MRRDRQPASKSNFTHAFSDCEFCDRSTFVTQGFPWKSTLHPADRFIEGNLFLSIKNHVTTTLDVDDTTYKLSLDPKTSIKQSIGRYTYL